MKNGPLPCQFPTLQPPKRPRANFAMGSCAKRSAHDDYPAEEHHRFLASPQGWSFVWQNLRSTGSLVWCCWPPQWLMTITFLCSRPGNFFGPSTVTTHSHLSCFANPMHSHTVCCFKQDDDRLVLCVESSPTTLPGPPKLEARRQMYSLCCAIQGRKAPAIHTIYITVWVNSLLAQAGHLQIMLQIVLSSQIR